MFTYCNNDPINETDHLGLILPSKLAEIFLSAACGMLAQLYDDLVIHFLQVLVHGKKKSNFNPNPSNYVSRALSWALECINPFSNKKKCLNVIFTILPLVVKTIWDLVTKEFDLWAFVRNIFYTLAAVIIANVLGKNTKNNIAKIKKHHKAKKTSYKAKSLQIKANIKVLGNNINVILKIAPIVVETIYNILVV